MNSLEPAGALASMAFFLMLATPAAAENIDPANNNSQFAFGENAGWLNAQPNGDGQDGLQVSDSALSGWMWGENVGWISLSCSNTASCGTGSYGVSNDACGHLAGHAWAENVGWINFSPATAGVTIDPTTGDFSGSAWGENIGWITFASTGAHPYKVTTSWFRPVPTVNPAIELSRTGSDLVLTWAGGGGADGYDVFQGSLADLRNTGGNFSASIDACLAEDQTGTSYQQSMSIGTTADFFLVRSVNCGGNGTSDTGGTGQVESRDGEIASSGTCQ